MENFDAKQYWEERLRQHFDLHGVGYLGRGHHYNRWLYKVRRRIFLRKMRGLRRNFSDLDILDVGSGTGFYIERWQELGAHRITGIDLTEIAVQNLQQKFSNLDFFQVDIGADLAGLDGRQFDIVSMFDVLFHIVEDARYQQALHNIYSVLKPDGLFIFSENFLHQNATGAAHQVSRSLDFITQAVTEVGFTIEERFPMFYLMNTPVDTENPLFKLSWRASNWVLSRSEILGYIAGAFLYPIELLLTAYTTESPSTEIMLCRKASGPS